VVGSNTEVRPLERYDVTGMDCMDGGLLVFDPKLLYQVRVTRAETRGPFVIRGIPLLAGGDDLEHPLL